MKLAGIRESGANNILRWAIEHGADIHSDHALQSIIDDETGFMLQIREVNYLELFRFAQMYRDRVRITSSYTWSFADETMGLLFPGSVQLDGQDIPLASVATAGMEMLINLAHQMSVDSDIIQPWVSKMFMPMMTASFEIQIPIQFSHLLSWMTEEDCQRVFTDAYPTTLIDLFEQPESQHLVDMIMLPLLRSTSIIRYPKKYETYIKATKYTPLNGYNGNTIYKVALVGFHRYDPVSRTDIRCSMFHPKAEDMMDTLKTMKRLDTPLKCDFIVQLPIALMTDLIMYSDRESMPVAYESSMIDIIDNGLEYHDFITPEEEDETFTNRVEAYRTRIAEANNAVMNALSFALDSKDDVDRTAAFAMLPPIYPTKAVITLDSKAVDMGVKRLSNIVIPEMIQKCGEIMNGVMADILKA